MIFYEIKLIHPQTKEIYFQSLGEKPQLPSKEVIKKFQGAVIVIKTTDSALKSKIIKK